MSYHIGSASVVAIPLYVRHSLTLRNNGDQGRLDLTVGPKQTMGRTLESEYEDSVVLVLKYVGLTLSSTNFSINFASGILK